MGADPLRFSLDGSLGRLARWLRLIGHDAAWERGDTLRTAALRARVEGRILLTRSRGLIRLGMEWPPPGGIVIAASSLVDQLAEVARRWPIFADPPVLSRCAECNEPLRSLPAPDAMGRVPPFVARTQSEYRICERCGRIYWSATHAEAILRAIRSAAKDAGEEGASRA